MGDFKFEIPDGLKNMVANSIIAGMCTDEETKELVEKSLKVFNKHGVTSDKAFRILIDLSELTNTEAEDEE